MLFTVPRSIRQLVKASHLWQEYYLILREFKHFRKIAVLALVFSFISAAFEGITIGLISSFLQGLTNPDEPPIQTGISWFDVGLLAVNAPTLERVLRLAALILVAIWLRSFFMYLAALYTSLSEFHLGDRIRVQIYEQLQQLSLKFYAKARSGELINSIVNEVYQVRQAFVVAASFLTNGFTLLAYVMSMLLLSWQLSIVTILAFTLLSVGLSTLMKKVREESFEISKANGHFTSVAVEFINGIRTVQASATQDFERKRFYAANSQIMNAATKAVSISSAVRPISQGTATTVLISMIVAAAALYVVNGELRAASLLTFMFVLSRLVPIISQLNGSWTQFNSFQGPLKNVRELLRRDDKEYLTNGTLTFTGLKQSIDFAVVNFAYDAGEPVLHDITLSIKRGEMTALVGASGAGKTTLADLLPRFYDPTSGKILLDGIDLREFDINAVRRKMAIVSQDTFIFNASVTENIAYGVERVDADAVREVAQLANALDFILELPDGFETRLGDRGVRLSGGQRQRIAIARALLRNPDILILDEATSALDSLTEQLIQESIERLAAGRTTIAIAHRLSTIVRADKVVVLERGRIVEQGKYHELLERRGKLWEYHKIQYELGQPG